MKNINLEPLEKNLGINFRQPAILMRALTHRSYLNEMKSLGKNSNERLEFLGDSILSFVISEWLFKTFSDFPEGDMTNIRSHLVKTSTLAQLARKFSIGEFLLMSRGETDSGGNRNETLLANAMEAIIGAVFLDQGLPATKNFIIRSFSPLSEKIISSSSYKDAKSLLQERIQAKLGKAPSYRVIKEQGPDHSKAFTVGVWAGNKLLATGSGKSKQKAEEEAAKKALGEQ